MTDVASTVVSFGPLIQTGLSVLSAVVLGLGGVAIHALNQWLAAKTGHQNLINEDTVRGYLHNALNSAVNYAVAKVGSADWATVDTKNALVAEAANYALAHVPDALAYFKIDQASLEALLIAKFGMLLGAPAVKPAA